MEIKLPEEGKTFLVNDIEYEVTMVSVDKERFSASPYQKQVNELREIKLDVGNKFMIDENKFVITYIHNTKKMITCKPFSSGY